MRRRLSRLDQILNFSLHCMLPIVQRAPGILHTVPFFSSVLDQCLSCTSSSNSLKLVHVQLIKLGFNTNTFLSNRCIDLYLRTGCSNDALKVFHEIPNKNIVSWNLLLKALVTCFNIHTARQVFDIMPERDSVSWNTIISGYISNGHSDHAWDIFLNMKNSCVKPSGFTFSIMFSCIKCASYVKEMHCYMIRNGSDNFSLVVWNSLIDLYGKTGLVNYAIAVFFMMDRVDIISWNSLISVCCQSGYERFGLHQFITMKRLGYKPDEYSVSAVLSACSNLRYLEKGKQIVCLCIKMGFLGNTIVSSAAIDMFSKCKKVQSAIYVFQNSCVLDSALINTMIACYASNGLEENALHLFVLSLRKKIRPTEFTMSCVLSASTVFLATELGIQIHSIIIKSGFELDEVVSSSLVEAYCKHGLIESAINVFDNMSVRDLIACNTMLLGLTHHGKLVDSIHLFHKLLDSGLHPDQITFSAVLSACSYGGFFEKGMTIFSSIKREYGIEPINEQYACVAVILSKGGEIEEAINLLQEMKIVPDAYTCESILGACGEYKDLELVERVAERMTEMEARSLLPYLILANAYEKKGRWERVVRVKREIKKMETKEETDCSLMGIKNRVFSFEGSQIVHHRGKDVYKVLELLAKEILDGMGTQISS